MNGRGKRKVHDEKCDGGKTGMVSDTERGVAVTVLLVDDDPMSQKVGRAILAHFGCRVDVAGNGREAVAAFSRQRYDMIFMDCQMPEMDGYEATGVIREREAQRRGSGDTVARIPIVALTGFAAEEDRKRCLQAGMDDYLSKPFSLAGVQSLLDRWLFARPALSPEGKGEQGLSGAESPQETTGGPARREEAPVIDRKALAMIAALQPQGSDDILKKVITLYLDSSLNLMKCIREAAQGNDADALYRAAHTLKSSSAYLGALTFSGMCKELEMIGRSKALEGAVARLAALAHEYERVRDALEKPLEGAAANRT
jgi:CheY-like chemotaxis protein/HPt (histidine-containing phosphotransfer) domain-containing protein